jgi:NTE family protein
MSASINFARRSLLAGGLAALAGCTQMPGRAPADPPLVAPPRTRTVAPRIALALGGGAARGFAHVGVISVLEASGIQPDLIVGTSAGSVVGAVYAAGYPAADLLRIAAQLDQAMVRDLTLPDRGFIRGEQLQNFINRLVQDRPIEKLNRPLAIVATDLQTGERMVFQRGNTGLAVRASSAVPGVFQPVPIAGRQYVDGGLTSPVPVRVARALGADLVIAVDISAQPRLGRIGDTFEVLLQTFAIMGQTIGQHELADADVVIRPAIGHLGPADFEHRNQAIAEGEKAARAALPEIRRRIAAATRVVTEPAP